MPFVTANDGIKLHYVERGITNTSVPPVVLVHGWSGSHRYFDNSIDLLAKRTGGLVVAVDLRFHGGSDKPAWGFHVARLAADLHDLLAALKLEQPVVVGTSLGCAIIWAFVELYTDSMLGKMVFVDQAPSQWTFPDWPYGSKGIYDPASLANIQAAVKDMPAFAKVRDAFCLTRPGERTPAELPHLPVFPACQGNAECCLTHTLPDELMATLTEETLKCNPDHLGRLMADHAQLDWRPVLPRITKPCLNLYGTTSGCFPVEGTAAVGELIPDCKNVPFEGCNHCEFAHGPLLHTDEPLIRRTQLRRSTHPHLAPHKNLMSPTWLRTAGLYLEKPDRFVACVGDFVLAAKK